MNTPKIPEPNATDLRKFGLIFGSLLIIFFGLLIPWIWGLEISLSKWPWPVGGIFVIWALIAPKTLKPVYKFWMRFGAVIGWINTRLILSLMFYLVMFPVGLVMRIFAEDPMERKHLPKANSYRRIHKKSASKQMEKPF